MHWKHIRKEAIAKIFKLYNFTIMVKMMIKEICKEKGVRQIDLANELNMRDDSLSIAIKNNTLSVSKLENSSK